MQLVPESGLNRANSLFQLADAAANLIAPAAAGVIVAWLGEGAVVATSAATSVFAALTLLMARIPELPAHTGDGRRSHIQRIPGRVGVGEVAPWEAKKWAPDHAVARGGPEPC